ncbi:flippase activity-associated protein Agl23 [Prosthecobacter sp.]|uniref:flippase activity-associated protein Agl23 n=1 Tax=Prosthecobacter sp. TaxID=1965333 RepID=UPI001DBC2074|nr:flippase activity-associated protein Agl23 [Prosthecobacter sp.]MCB1279750.1 TIGR03663 family protein [Prosthecobacter sp.]
MPPPPKNSLSLFGLTLFTIISLALGAYYRFPSLGERPMHTDEAILAMKSAEFQATGHFQYDPKDFHGPGLHYITRVWARLAGWGDSSTWTEAQLRTVPVICGLLLLLSTLLLRDALGRYAAGLAMLLISISPMMVYYSRYFIMEVPLVLFITLSIAALWRYSQGGGRWWLVVAGFSLGMQHATKETFAINVVAGVIGFVVARLTIGDFAPRRSGFDIGLNKSRASKPWLWVIIVAIATSIAIYSGGFKDWQAVKDSALTYLNYLERSGGSGHEKPWHYYLTLIFWRKDGLVWSEAMIGGLGIIGMLYSFLGNHQKHPTRQPFLVFLSVYTLVLFAVYSFLAYKTPWSILSAQHALTLLAGVGAAAISRALTGRIPRLAFRIAFGIGLYHLIAQTNIAIHNYAADSRNPYVYSHTSTNLMRLRPQLRELQKIAPDDNFNVLVVNRDAGWPLPWYWRDIKTVRYESTLPETLDARVIVAETDMTPAVEAKFDGKTYFKQGPFGLRPGVLLNMWVEQSLWDRYKLRKEQEATAP